MTEFSAVPAYNPSLEDDLISAERWKDQEAVLREVGAPILLA